ncbi:MAG: hypothetical protein HY302_15030 [Opitutae bacterium]|nr:hypothetical protein [Opitutae bacterium]
MARVTPKERGLAPPALPLPRKPDCKSGLILICDVVDFSPKARTDQGMIVERLWKFVHADKQQKLLGREALINGTGDGLMIACPGHEKQVDHADFLQFALNLIGHMERAQPGSGLRVGVHQGPFSQLRPPGAEVYQAIGTGINQCARLVGIGDSGDITVSEDFIKGWAEDAGKKVRAHFLPAPKHDPYAVVVKRGQTSLLRFYRPGKKRSVLPPRKIATFDRVKQLVKDHLELMARTFESYASMVDPALTPELINVRASIFALPGESDSAELHPTQFRFHARNHEVKPGETKYSITGRGTGPVGRAFVANRHQCLHGLPDYDQAAAAYIRSVQKTGLTKTEIVNFRRHARAFVAVPFGLNSDQAEGVVCLDTISPLQSLKPADLNDLAELLSAQFSAPLAAFWRLRGQL